MDADGRVGFDGRWLRIGSERRPYLGGELHFWRTPSEHWQRLLQRAQELRLSFVSTYVSWENHEPTPGHYDFTGRTAPRRDLRAILDTVAASDLWLMIRPGPYLYAELPQMGVPQRVAHLHRLHPDFLAAAGDYLAAVIEVLIPYLATRGGPIILLQADNEPDLWERFYAQQVGLGAEPGVFQAWLADHYAHDIAALNATWEAAYSRFADARAVMQPYRFTRGTLNRYLDYRRFRYHYTSAIFRWAAEQYRAQGVDVPITANVYPFVSVQDWTTLGTLAPVVGVDYYAQDCFQRDAWEHREFVHQMRINHAVAQVPVLSEMQAGIWHGWHYASGVLHPDHYLLMGLSALLAGAVGWNWYMLADRENWSMSPLNAHGYARPELLPVFQQLADLVHGLEPAALDKLTPLAMTVYPLDRSSEIGGFSDPVAAALYAAGLDYMVYETSTGQHTRPLIFYGGGDWLPADHQQRLREAVVAGATLVCFDRLPLLDEYLNPSNQLAIPEPAGLLHGGAVTLATLGGQAAQVDRLLLYDVAALTQAGWQPLEVVRALDTTEYHAEEGNTHFQLPVGQRLTVGCRQQCGQGSIIVLGVSPSAAVIRAVLAWLEVRPACQAKIVGVQSALFRHTESPERLVLIAVHTGDRAMQARIRLDAALLHAQRYQVRDLLTGQEYELTVDASPAVTITLPSYGGGAWLMTSV